MNFYTPEVASRLYLSSKRRGIPCVEKIDDPQILSDSNYSEAGKYGQITNITDREWFLGVPFVAHFPR